MRPKYLNDLIEDSYSLFTRIKRGIRKAGLVALAGAIIGGGSMAYGKVEPKEDALPKKPVSLEEKLYKQTKIAFDLVSIYPNYTSYDIYVMNADGSEQKQLTNAPRENGSGPSWSPDGKKIAFYSERGGKDLSIFSIREIYFMKGEIYVMNVDGSEQKRLTNNFAFDGVSSWSLDGKKIAFVSNRDGNSEIYVMNADGTNQTRLTFNERRDTDPSWSPDGKKIAFVSTRNIPEDIIFRRDAIDDICVMNADGSEQKNLTNSFTYGGASPSWSPDGKRITFMSRRDGNSEIYVMNADGTNQTRLTFNEKSKDTDPWRPSESLDVSPLWGPDGKKIAFRSYRDGNFEIYVMNADGSEQKNLTNNPGDDEGHSWSPDGKKITFMSRREEEDYEIYIMNVDGSEQKNLTKNIPGYFKRYPSWSPFLPLENKTNEKK